MTVIRVKFRMPAWPLAWRHGGSWTHRQHQSPDDGVCLLTSAAACWTIRRVLQPIEYRWRGPVTDVEIVALVTAHGGRAAAGWWDQIRPHSLGWVTARQPDGDLVGFVNVAWDGGDHAFLLDTKVASENQRQGIATALVGHAVLHTKAAGCEWLHVDFEEHLTAFYFDACGFRPTSAGLIHLPTSHRQGQEPPD
jgi:GNAT superfamily N-acetyltransferase